jgi:hypothetical protein
MAVRRQCRDALLLVKRRWCAQINDIEIECEQLLNSDNSGHSPVGSGSRTSFRIRIRKSDNFEEVWRQDVCEQMCLPDPHTRNANSKPRHELASASC